MTPQTPVSPVLNLRSIRARKSRLSTNIGKTGSTICLWLIVLGTIGGLYCLLMGKGNLQHTGYTALAVATAAAMLFLWYRYDLQKVALNHPAKQLDDILEPRLLNELATIKGELNPHDVWEAAVRCPEALFVCNRLLIDVSMAGALFSANSSDLEPVWHQALELTKGTARGELHAGSLATACILMSPAMEVYLSQNKLTKQEVLEVWSWLERQLEYLDQPKPYFGGIGRDWASGFTPNLDQFSQNISHSVELSGGGAPFLAHSELLDGIVSSLARDNAVALVGNDGTGKTTLMYGLAQRLLEGRDHDLQYYQIVSLNASVILSYSGAQLEHLMLTLFGETVAAGNIILFLDDAQLFFSSGVGSFDMSQILLPILKNRRIKIIAAFTPTDWQGLQAQRQTLAGGFASITVTEPPEAVSYKVIEDTALLLEHRHKTLVSYEAVREAYRLSGQFMQEQSYPGKAVSLLEQSMTYATQGALTAESVQTAVERTKGVKVSAAQAPEAEMLLHLEDKIHERMINQKRAVSVVASALRRGRAGVSNPKRPVGSFLFLGPTGVGKTELARSLAAVYFGDEHQMIRLDMSEYQRPEDVSRLLATGGQADHSLLLAIREQPFSVVLLDEVEKAHPNILNLLLQMLDEGQLTDEQGRPASFRSAIIIATSNAGAPDIAKRVKDGGVLDDFERPLIDKLIADGQFKPELVNRFDEVVLFRPLNEAELSQVANVMLKDVNKTLATQQISVQLTPEALKVIVHEGYDPEFGARPMRRIIQKTVENAIAVKILSGQVQPGSTVTLDVADLHASEKD